MSLIVRVFGADGEPIAPYEIRVYNADVSPVRLLEAHRGCVGPSEIPGLAPTTRHRVEVEAGAA